MPFIRIAPTGFGSPVLLASLLGFAVSLFAIADDFTSLKASAEQSDLKAQFSLGWMFANGQGVSANPEEAARWFRKAAEQGHAAAQCDLGSMFASGQGVPKNTQDAYMWFNLAAANGYAGALENRAMLERQMTPEQVAEARRLSAQFVPHTPLANPASGNNPPH